MDEKIKETEETRKDVEDTEVKDDGAEAEEAPEVVTGEVPPEDEAKKKKKTAYKGYCYSFVDRGVPRGGVSGGGILQYPLYRILENHMDRNCHDHGHEAVACYRVFPRVRYK